MKLVHKVIHTGLFTMIYQCILYISFLLTLYIELFTMLCFVWSGFTYKNVHDVYRQVFSWCFGIYIHKTEHDEIPCIHTGLFTMLSPSISSSQASPIPSKSTSSCPLFGTSRQLSYNHLQHQLYIVWQKCLTLSNILVLLFSYFVVPSTYSPTPELLTAQFNVGHTV